MKPQVNTYGRAGFLCAGGFLFLFAIWLYLPSVQFAFIVTMDDSIYVLNNPMVLNSFSGESIHAAFTQTYAASYQPLVWLSFMLDHHLFGLDPMGYHLVNILWHGANAFLFFWLLVRTTRNFWCGFFAALLFAVHPMRVESVAWITERKDVLSTFFFLITLILYANWTERRSYWLYLATCLAFVLSLMTKAMAVTLPFLLIFFDYWPLRRWEAPRISAILPNWTLVFSDPKLRKLWLEKVPFLAISLFFCAATLLGARSDAATVSYERLPFIARVLNAFVSVSQYVRKTLFPYDLAPLYPHPWWWPWPAALAAVVFVLLCTCAAIWLMRRAPYVFAGWFFFLIGLLPIIGFIQSGTQAMADRFVYLPCLGLIWALVWGIAALSPRIPGMALAAAGVVAALALSWTTRVYLPVWQNSGTVFDRATAMTDNNYVAHLNVSVWHLSAGNYDKAFPHLQALIRIRPDDPGPRLNIGLVLFEFGHDRLAYEAFEKAIALNEPSGNAFLYKGILLERAGQAELAEVEFAAAYEMHPSNMRFVQSYANILASRGKNAQALSVLERALNIKSGWHPDVRPGLEAQRSKLLQGNTPR